MAEIWTIIVFVISIVISTVIIYFITKVLGEREGIKYAFFAAISGSIIYGIFNNLIGNNSITSIIEGALWFLY